MAKIEENTEIKEKLRKKNYNSDKISVQIYKTTHEKLKMYCDVNKIKMKDHINNVILSSIK